MQGVSCSKTIFLLSRLDDLQRLLIEPHAVLQMLALL